METPLPPLKVAILINGYESPNTPAIRSSFISSITSASKPSDSQAPIYSHPVIKFYDPIVAQEYPNPAEYDLIVLSGGTADPMGRDPWVLRLQDNLRATVKNFPTRKLLGICWGHQTICVAFGGSIGSMNEAEIGVTKIGLTEEGKKKFPFSPDGNLFVHEFHRRQINVTAREFVPLAEGNQAFVNEKNTITTFQGHPEFNKELGKKLLEKTPIYMGVEEKDMEVLNKKMESEHDGVAIWGRILKWIRE